MFVTLDHSRHLLLSISFLVYYTNQGSAKSISVQTLIVFFFSSHEKMCLELSLCQTPAI